MMIQVIGSLLYIGGLLQHFQHQQQSGELGRQTKFYDGNRLELLLTYHRRIS